MMSLIDRRFEELSELLSYLEEKSQLSNEQILNIDEMYSKGTVLHIPLCVSDADGDMWEIFIEDGAALKGDS